MTQFLVVGSAIMAAGPFTMTPDEIRAPDVIFPVHTIQGWQVVAAELPSDFTPAAYEWRGGLVAKVPMAPLPTQDEYVAAAQERLDAFARTRNYDGILSACTYASSAVPRFAAEGDYAVAARDSTWAKGYDLLSQVQAGVIPQPTLEQFVAMLPVLEWPA